FSQRSIAYKKENNLTTGRNVAIVVFKSPKSQKQRYTIASTQGHPCNAHAEIKALDLIPKNGTVQTIYSERKPCQKGSNCHRKLKAVVPPDAEIIHSIEYSIDPNERKISEKEFRS